MKRYVVVIVALMLLGAVGYYVLGTEKKGEAAPVGQIQKVVKVSKGNLSLAVSANGVVQPVTKIDIKSKASGIIQQLNFNEGSHVREGELLIQTDTITTRNNYDQALSDVATAEASLKQSQNNWTRTTGLFEKGLASQQDVDAANVDLVRAKSTLQRAQSSLSTASDALRDTKVRAPITGTILSKSVELGTIIASAVSNVGGGTTLATIADMDTVNIETSVDEVDIGKVKEGLRASVKADAYPDDTFPGWVLRIAPLGKTQSNVTVFTVIIQVQNIGEKLKAGMSASVDIEVFNRQNVVLVPNEALKDPRSEQGQAMMSQFNLVIPKDTTKAGDGSNGSVAGNSSVAANDALAKLRERMRTATPEERQQLQQEMRTQFEKMSPEDRQRMFEQMRQRGGGGRGSRSGSSGDGGGFAANGGGGQNGVSTFQRRRQSQVSDGNGSKWRIVVARQGTDFAPKLVKVGPSNFDYAEVLDGLNDGDEVQITTISRAKVAAEAMVDRMRQGSSALGAGGGGGGMRVR